MSQQQLNQFITILVLAIVFICLIVLIVLLIVRHNKYKDFVLKNSESIKLIEDINQKYIFKKYTSRINVYFRFDNKSAWRRTEPVAFLTREIREKLPNWYDLKDTIIFNRNLLKKYKSEVKKIYHSISSDVCTTNKMNFKKCIKMEKKIFNSKIQKPSCDLTVNVTLRYVSPKGKVDIKKEDNFNFERIVRIIDSVSMRRVDYDTYQRLATAERSLITDSMRYDVLKRDGFRCVLCGMSSADGAILHVDHIIPVSKGGKSEMDNLRTLCERCNLGKSNKIE